MAVSCWLLARRWRGARGTGLKVGGRRCEGGRGLGARGWQDAGAAIRRAGEGNLGQTVVVTLDNPEGIEFLPDGRLAITEDIDPGRLLGVSLSGEVEVLLTNLSRPEGLAVSAEGAIYFVEEGAGTLSVFKDGRTRVVVGGMNNPDQITFAPDGALWISEDARPGRLLRHHAGSLETIAEDLHAPQGIAFGAAGEVYVSEQGRDRILVLRRK